VIPVALVGRSLLRAGRWLPRRSESAIAVNSDRCVEQGWGGAHALRCRETAIPGKGVPGTMPRLALRKPRAACVIATTHGCIDATLTGDRRAPR
jgi:hypothetical protein